MWLPMKTVAVIPAFNEEKTIKNVVRGLKNSVDEIIVVNDGSTDKTEEIAKTLGVTLVSHVKNRGYGGSIRSGFKKGLESNGDIFLLIDADLQHDPKESARLIDFLRDTKADMVIGSRYLQHKSKIPLYRSLGIRLFTLLTWLFIGVRVSDAQSGFRVFNRNAIEKIINFENDNMGASIEILHLAKKNNLKIAEYPITCAYENVEYSVHPLRHGIQLLNILLRISFKSK